jgi:hypothetical protein
MSCAVMPSIVPSDSFNVPRHPMHAVETLQTVRSWLYCESSQKNRYQLLNDTVAPCQCRKDGISRMMACGEAGRELGAKTLFSDIRD